MHNLGFTNNQILGHFFVLGAVIATPASVDEREQNKQAITALAPFNHNVLLDDLIGPRFVPQERPIEEFLHWLGIEIDFRLVEIEGLKPRQTLTPQSHDLFAAKHKNVTTMASVHGLYLDFYEVLGTRMNETNISASEALQIGIFQQQLNFMTDRKATRDINNCLSDFMSPVLKAVRDFGMCGTPDRLDQQLDTQIALQGLWGGLDDLFLSLRQFVRSSNLTHSYFPQILQSKTKNEMPDNLTRYTRYTSTFEVLHEFLAEYCHPLHSLRSLHHFQIIFMRKFFEEKNYISDTTYPFVGSRSTIIGTWTLLGILIGERT
jgi:hypothetical protein